jgi:hypothetical protein
MEVDKVSATVEVMIQLEELRIKIAETGLVNLIDAIPSLLKKGSRISITDGLKIVAGK